MTCEKCGTTVQVDPKTITYNEPDTRKLPEIDLCPACCSTLQAAMHAVSSDVSWLLNKRFAEPTTGVIRVTADKPFFEPAETRTVGGTPIKPELEPKSAPTFPAPKPAPAPTPPSKPAPEPSTPPKPSGPVSRSESRHEHESEHKHEHRHGK